jgi:hypothetical protein
MGALDLLNTALALLGGGVVAVIGTLLKLRSEVRTSARLVYAELTRNCTSVAYFRRTDTWPAATGGTSRTVWEQHGPSVARFQGGGLFHEVHRGYAALEGVQFIAADSALAEPQRSDLVDLAVSDLLSAVRALAAVAGIPQDRLDAEVRRLSARPVGPGGAEASGGLTDSGAVPPALLATIVDRSGADAPPSARHRAHGPVECTVYDAGHSRLLPGTLARGWGDRPTGDPAVDDAYDILVQTCGFFHDVFGRRSIDNHGTPLTAVVHFGDGFGNTFWNGNRIIIGDGDDLVFKRFSVAPEVVVAELCNMMPEIARFGGAGQSGALGASLRDVFGLLARQYAHGEAADDASWIVGEGLLLPGVDGEGLRSFRLPGTAYDDPVLGSDPQAAHMDEYRDEPRAEQREAAVHRNSGIPSRAFYRAAVALGGHAWECAGAVWYHTLTHAGPQLPGATGDFGDPAGLGSSATFAAFAERTVAVADKRYGSVATRVVRQAWTDIGVL